MATTTVPTGLTVQQWDERYFREYLNKNWFKSMMGTGSSSMIQVKEDLTKKPGDAVTFTLVNKLTGTAKDHFEALEGQEEAADLRSQKVTVREYSHAVRFSKFEAQKTAINLRQAHKDILMDWNMELDRDNILEALGSINGVPFASSSEAQRDAWLADNADRVLFGQDYGHTEADFDFSDSVVKLAAADDKLDSDALSLMKRLAKRANPKVRPIRSKSSISGSDMYVALVPSYCLRDLRADTAFQQANRDARQRGMDNPLFSDADYVWDNIAIYEVEDIQSIGNLGAASEPIYPVYLCGAQALGMAWSMRPQTVTEDFDYQRSVGLAIKQWYKVEKLRFGSGSSDTADLKDHGLVTGYFVGAAD
jgi:N4-gp56 family major capsid protein